LLFAAGFLLTMASAAVSADDGDTMAKNNFGGIASNEFTSAAGMSDGFVAVGRSTVSSFGTGDWADTEGKGDLDAIIVRYDDHGNILWKKNFGGNRIDEFLGVTAVPGGVVAVGRSLYESFGTGDWADTEGKGGFDAIIVKFDDDGNVIWKKNFGGDSLNIFVSVTSVSDGTVAVGSSHEYSFGTGDWADTEGKGAFDAIIVKFDNDGNIVWKKSFGGNDTDEFFSVTAVSGGIVAAGNSCEYSFGTGDWADTEGKGDTDAIIIKFDNDGNIVWKKNFGGIGEDVFSSLTSVPGGIVAAGRSAWLGTGDWEGVDGQGIFNATVVKFDNDGSAVWKKCFGGAGFAFDWFRSVVTVPGGVVAAGVSSSFGTGDWEGVDGNGLHDAIIVRYDNDGNIVWKKNFGGAAPDSFQCAAVMPGAIVAVGDAANASFDTGDWEGIIAKGEYNDAIFAIFEMPGAGDDDAGGGTEEGSDDGTDDATEEGTDEGTDDATEEGTDDGTDDATEEGTDDGTDDGTAEDLPFRPRSDLTLWALLAVAGLLFLLIFLLILKKRRMDET
jgi:hypothetical protein